MNAAEQPAREIHKCEGSEKDYHRESHLIWHIQSNGLTYGKCQACKMIFAVEVDGNRVFTDIQITQNV